VPELDGERGAEQRLARAMDAAIGEVFSGLRRSVRKTLAVVTLGFVQLLGACRSGHGKLSLAALARCLPTEGTPHAREKRLHRFLVNPRLDPKAVSDGLARMIVGRRGGGLWPIVFDQTKAGSTQALVAGVPFEGRVLPLLVYTFEYPWQEAAASSQNQLEEIFLADVETALPAEVRGVFIGDRGYGRASLLQHCGTAKRLYVIRGRAGTRVEWEGRHLKLRELTAEPGRVCRYRGVFYQAERRVLLDVVAYHNPEFQDPWWLLVPPNSESLLPDEVVVALYRERMQVEHGFRDFKTHLGLRGLKLKQNIAERTGRLLLGFFLAYTLAVCLGASAAGQAARAEVEVPRRQPRHGTTRTLSVLSLACVLLSLPRWRRAVRAALRTLVERISRGARLLKHPPPGSITPFLLAA